MVTWRDAIKISLSSNQNNYDCLYSEKELANQMKPFSRRIFSIIYCQRNGTPNDYQDLRTANLPAVSNTRDTISKRKEKNNRNRELKKYRPLHQSTTTGMKTFFIVLRHKGVAKRIIGKNILNVYTREEGKTINSLRRARTASTE